MLENRLELLTTLAALSKLGVIGALINIPFELLLELELQLGAFDGIPVVVHSLIAD